MMQRIIGDFKEVERKMGLEIIKIKPTIGFNLTSGF